ncbi:hypothetical protein [Streptomyces sp. NRRL F-4474]|uniref:hypothetical protein n=1 Tax=Streptomyces sp. NRRL F-4474 TaxID=1463851 RepID=UPI0004C61051|nr:hypothetical protein [Streptomyces sp. NRRL F-4474]
MRDANHPMLLNRYGFPSHLPPWQFVPGNTIEVNYMREYRHLHDAGYHVLTWFEPATWPARCGTPDPAPTRPP